MAYIGFTALRLKATFALCTVCLLSACTMAPKYERPGMPVPVEYHKGAGLYGQGGQNLAPAAIRS